MAEHVGPHVQMRTDTPDSSTGPGRRRRPGPAGLAFFIDPVDDHTWESLRASWNHLYGNQPGWGYTRKEHQQFRPRRPNCADTTVVPRADDAS